MDKNQEQKVGRIFRKGDIFTIPNIICYLRILLIPVFCWMYLTAETPAEYLWAAFVVLFSSFTDLFDGMIARKFNQVTDLGKILDPVADKLTHAAVAICIAMRYPVMWALIALMAVKEGFMGIMGLIFLRKGRMMNGAMWPGKVSTAALFIGLVILLLFPSLPVWGVYTAVCVMMAAMLCALVYYIGFYRRLIREDKENGVKKE